MNILRNSVTLIGNLGRDIEVKELSSGTKVARITIATNDYYKNNKGETITDTQWHNLVAWGGTAERMASMLHKGSEVAIQGKLVHSSYEDKDGNMRYKSEVKINDFVKMAKKEKEAVPF